MITSSWSNRVVTIFRKLDPSWFSSFRSCKQNGEESYDFFVQSASILCHLLINFRSCGCWSSLLHLSWHIKLFLAFPVRWTYQKRAALFARPKNVEDTLYTRWLSTRRVKPVCTPRVRVVERWMSIDCVYMFIFWVHRRVNSVLVKHLHTKKLQIFHWA